jgi:hypothetical protein
MLPSSITELENQLRSAVVARRYEDVRRIAPQFCAAARTAIVQLRPGDPVRREIVLHVDRTLEWARDMLIVARTFVGTELRRFTFLQKYALSVPQNASNTKTNVEA